MVCDLWSVSVWVFQGLLLVIVIMIDGSKKRNCEDGFWTLEFACLWKAQWKRFCVDRASIILTDLILYTKQSESGLWKKNALYLKQGQSLKASAAPPLPKLPSIMWRGHPWHEYLITIVVNMTRLLYVQSTASHYQRRWLGQFTVRFRPIRKEKLSSMYNYLAGWDWRLLTCLRLCAHNLLPGGWDPFGQH